MPWRSCGVRSSAAAYPATSQHATPPADDGGVPDRDSVRRKVEIERTWGEMGYKSEILKANINLRRNVQEI